MNCDPVILNSSGIPFPFKHSNSEMSVVAVAGGLGDMGRLITQALFKTGKYEVYVMSRKVSLNSMHSHRDGTTLGSV